MSTVHLGTVRVLPYCASPTHARTFTLQATDAIGFDKNRSRAS